MSAGEEWGIHNLFRMTAISRANCFQYEFDTSNARGLTFSDGNGTLHFATSCVMKKNHLLAIHPSF